MKHAIRWSPEARNDLVRLHSFLDEHNPAAAWRALEAIQKAVHVLQIHPNAGKQCQLMPSMRQVYIPFGKKSYIISYRLDEADNVLILRIWNSRESWLE